MIFKTIVLVALFVVAQTTIAENPQQQVCARPDKGCGTQVKIQSCINWHGCLWRGSSSTGNFCRDDKDCSTKATKVPTQPPNVPTMKPTMKPTSPTNKPTTAGPTMKPTVRCEMPPVPCARITKPTSCANWSGCVVVGKKCQPNPTCA